MLSSSRESMDRMTLREPSPHLAASLQTRHNSRPFVLLRSQALYQLLVQLEWSWGGLQKSQRSDSLRNDEQIVLEDARVGRLLLKVAIAASV